MKNPAELPPIPDRNIPPQEELLESSPRAEMNALEAVFEGIRMGIYKSEDYSDGDRVRVKDVSGKIVLDESSDGFYEGLEVWKRTKNEIDLLDEDKGHA